jgi:hypothetical protein
MTRRLCRELVLKIALTGLVFAPALILAMSAGVRWEDPVLKDPSGEDFGEAMLLASPNAATAVFYAAITWAALPWAIAQGVAAALLPGALSLRARRIAELGLALLVPLGLVARGARLLPEWPVSTAVAALALGLASATCAARRAHMR